MKDAATTCFIVAGMQGCIWQPATSTQSNMEVSHPSKVSDFFLRGRKTREGKKNLVALERNSAQLHSYMALAGNQTRDTSVKDECFVHYANHATKGFTALYIISIGEY